MTTHSAADTHGGLLAPVPAESFYEQTGEGEYVSTRATESPWHAEFQHGGPPAGLLAREIEQSLGSEPMVVGKLEVDFLGPIPQGRCTIEVEVIRPGRMVRQVQATMRSQENGERAAVVARSWVFSAESGRTEHSEEGSTVSDLPEPGPQYFFEGIDPSWGYGRAIEWRFVHGGGTEAGAARVWTRVRVPLVAEQSMTDLQRMLVVSDSTNGVSAALPMRHWLSIPPSLTVAVLRPPTEEWFVLDARSTIASHGTGVAESVIADDHGLCAHVLQPLLVTPR